MRLTPVEQLRVGDRLGRDVCVGASTIPLLRTGARISAAYVDGLRRAGVTGVWVDDDLSAGIVPLEPVREQTRREAVRSLEQAFDGLARREQAPARVSEETVHTLTEIAAQIAADVALCGEAAVAIADLATHDGYTLNHSIDVTAVGLLVAQRLWTLDGWIDYAGIHRYDSVESRLVKLGLGLLLHDVGKLALPLEVLQKPGRLDPEELELVREHPEIGYAMLAGAGILSPLVKDVVRHHHERWNGSGYPHGKVGRRISQFARIAAVADVFDAIASERSYKPAAPVHVAWETIVDGSGELFDPEIVEMFRRVIAPYPPGLAVELSDGTRGIVAACPPWAADRPTVRVVAGAGGLLPSPVEVKLAERRDLQVVAVGAPLPDTAAVPAA